MEDQTFGEKLKTERESLGLSRVELAQQIGTSSKTIARWERGETLPRPRFHEKLTTTLNLSPQELGLATDIQKEREIVHYSRPEITSEGGTFGLYIIVGSVFSSAMLEMLQFEIRSLHSLEYLGICASLPCIPVSMPSIEDFPPKPLFLAELMKQYCPSKDIEEINDLLNFQKNNVQPKQIRIFDSSLFEIKNRVVILKNCKATKKALQIDRLYSIYKGKVFPLIVQVTKKPLYLIARNLADNYHFAIVSCIFTIIMPSFFNIHPLFQIGGLVNSMQNIIQEVLQVLSNPAWQGFGSILALVSIIISLRSRHSNSTIRSPKKNQRRTTFFSVPPLFPHETLHLSKIYT